MATQRHVVETIVQGRDNASQVLDLVQGKLGGFEQFAVAGAAGVAAAAAGTAITIGALAFDTANQLDSSGRLIQKALGDNADAALNYRAALTTVFAGNVGEGFQDIAQVIVQTEQNTRRLGDVSQAVLTQMTTDAIRVRDTFNQDTNEVLSASATLMDAFGLSSQQAFDFIVAGNQRGLNASNDFLDTINEYSVQFQNAGADAGEFFSLLETGVRGGTFLGTDRVADLFGEFRKRILDGTTLTRDSLQALGLNADQVLGSLADRNIDVADAFALVVDRIRAIDDPIQRNIAGVGLLGTQFEDLGDEAVRALSFSTTAMADLAGSTQQMADVGRDLSTIFRGFGREFLLALEPAGSAILRLVRDNLPALEAAVRSVAGTVGSIAEGFANIVVDFAVGYQDGGFEAGLATAIAGAIARTDFGQTQIGAQVAGAIGAAVYAVTAEDPPWLALLLTYAWPAVPTAIDILTGDWDWPPLDADAVTSWEWPSLGGVIAPLLGWHWPSAPDVIDNLLQWSWPAVPGVIAGLIAWQWPAAPAWIDRLLNFRFADRLPTPLGAGGVSPPVTSGITPQGLPLLSAGPPQVVPVMAEVVNWLFGGGAEAVIDATANVTAVDTANAVIEAIPATATIDTEPEWGDWNNNYEVMATVNDQPDFGTFDHVYAVAAQVDREPNWGRWSPHQYPARARVTGVDWRESFFTTTYRATARITQFVTQVVSSILPQSNQAGTDFFSGGPTLIHQGEMLLFPPRGSRIIPADRVNTLLRGGNGGDNYNITIHAAPGSDTGAIRGAVTGGILSAARARGKR